MNEINEYGQRVGEALPDWVGGGILAGNTLSGRTCRLVPMDARRDAADLFAAFAEAEGDRDWTWLSSVRPSTAVAMQAWMQKKVDDASLIPFVVVDLHTAQAVGVVCLMAIDPANGSLEIGHVSWSPRMQRTTLSTEAIWLLLREAFSGGYRRVEWKCDSLNTASRRAAERIGFRFEGRFRQHMVRKGRSRDTDWLSVIDKEWSEVDAVLQAWLAEDNFDAMGRQRRTLTQCRER
ncbi:MULTISPECIES: GNAT family N-acetyltransferase [Edwardsiella]|uniref:GNAT family N-acetyltransferase n=2 Tax=Edwardsiella anguillarum TaxID=1821960 RepID=A0ABY8SE46_9GAMM|nr:MULTISPECIES: GNAT family protein [Edwardsiella]AKM47037.1 GCN5 family acetyltransferase [Edwardsiella sp. EA181011]GAJ67305.1 N-acetyltransferase GCN5 [Edwardsiella piscicida]AIJ07427.1 Putative acetyltransferase [Edwardsiella anguillarum ET080813]AKR78674.1 GNAT family N-acetyltransferase [Edwardsiella sp. LADL05-105]KAB0586787.1 GNAT family N-acetyltransferase [Edwardsiella anguillarum]